jgi:hypothetical protein
MVSIFEVHDYPEIEALPVVETLRLLLEKARQVRKDIPTAGERWQAMEAVCEALRPFVDMYMTLDHKATVPVDSPEFRAAYDAIQALAKVVGS